MNKEQFMAMSHPYYLKVLVDTSHLVEEREPFIAVLAGLFDFEYYTVKYTDESCVSYTDINMRIKPILHPLSDLTKPIEHKGEVFVPIVELAKMLFTKYPRHVFIEKDKCYLGECIENPFKRAYNYRFMYDKSHKGFSLMSQFYDGSYHDDEDRFVPNQLELFQKLIEWHFDIAGLIEKGEAIDVNILPENPYK